MKKLSVAKLKKEADKWHSKAIRYRDGEIENGVWVAECITCGVKKPITQMQCGHFVSRSKNILRYDELNTNAQCVGCNMFKAGEQYLYSKALDEKYGAGTAEELMSKRFETHKLTVEELEQIIHDSKEQVKWYESQC